MLTVHSAGHHWRRVTASTRAMRARISISAGVAAGTTLKGQPVFATGFGTVRRGVEICMSASFVVLFEGSES